MSGHPGRWTLAITGLLLAAGIPSAYSQTKPTVISTNPADGAANVSRMIPSMSVTFSKAMNSNICGIATSGWGTGTYAWSSDKKTMTYSRSTPSTPLASGSVVRGYMNQVGTPPNWICRDTDGNALDPFSFSFTIGGPVVVSTTPAADATVKATVATVSVTFNVEMDTTSCSASTDKWLGGVANCAWSADKKSMTFSRPNPGTPHTSGVTVVVTLNPAGQTPLIKDSGGNPLDTYSFSFFVERSPAQLTKVAPNPAKGFSWPYYLYVPGYLKSPQVLMVEPNNTGYVSDDPGVHDSAALALINFEMGWADYAGVPYLVPAFPRPAWDVDMYVHALDRKTLLTTAPGLVRVDMQLIAMIRDAQALLAAKGILVDPKVFMLGGSASGMFVNRFVLLHPEVVKAAMAGAPGYGPMVPVGQWNGVQLPYPEGIADMETLVGKKFDLETFRSVPQSIWVGDEDMSNYPWWESTDPELVRILAAFVGREGYQRWPRYQAAFDSVGSNSQFVIFPGMPHAAPPWEWMVEFFERNRSAPQPPEPKPYFYKFTFPQVASTVGWETEIGLVNSLPDGVTVRGQLQAFSSSGGNPIQTADVAIPPGGRKEITVGSSFQNPSSIAYLTFLSDSGFVAGYARFQQPSNWASLVMAKGSTKGWFPKVETDGWTGIAFVNVEALIATVHLTALDNKGNPMASTVLTVYPGQKFVGMVNQLFSANVTGASYIKYESDMNLVAFSVSGSTDGQMLDGLNATNGYVRMWR